MTLDPIELAKIELERSAAKFALREQSLRKIQDLKPPQYKWGGVDGRTGKAVLNASDGGQVREIDVINSGAIPEGTPITFKGKTFSDRLPAGIITRPRLRGGIVEQYLAPYLYTLNYPDRYELWLGGHIDEPILLDTVEQVNGYTEDYNYSLSNTSTVVDPDDLTGSVTQSFTDNLMSASGSGTLGDSNGGSGGEFSLTAGHQYWIVAEFDEPWNLVSASLATNQTIFPPVISGSEFVRGITRCQFTVFESVFNPESLIPNGSSADPFIENFFDYTPIGGPTSASTSGSFNISSRPTFFASRPPGTYMIVFYTQHTVRLSLSPSGPLHPNPASSASWSGSLLFSSTPRILPDPIRFSLSSWRDGGDVKLAATHLHWVGATNTSDRKLSYFGVTNDTIDDTQTDQSNNPSSAPDITPLEDDWRSSLVSFSDSPTTDPDPCRQAYRLNSEANIQDIDGELTLLACDLQQEVDDTPLETLLESQDVTGNLLQITTLTSGETCEIGDSETQESTIEQGITDMQIRAIAPLKTSL